MRIFGFQFGKGPQKGAEAMTIKKVGTISPLQFPCDMNAANVLSLVLRHGQFEGKFVFHINTKELSLGESSMPHPMIAKATMANPDMFTQSHPNIVGGKIHMNVQSDYRKIEIKMTSNSQYYARNRDVSKAMDRLIELLKRHGYQVCNRQISNIPGDPTELVDMEKV